MASMRFIIHLLLYTTALSLPIDHQQVLRNVECHRVDVYTPDWFLRNTLPGYRREIHGRALFYTKGASKYAQRLACKSTDYVSIWQIWPPWLYNDKDTPENPLRCIHSDYEMTKTFYENMSKAYARMARKHATVMHMSSDYANPPQDGIWGRIELPALRHQTDITEMIKINEDSTQHTRWLVADKSAKSMADKAIEEVQRIFRSAKSTRSQASDIADVDVDSCALWASKEDGFLDSLW